MADNRTGLSAADLAAQFRDVCGDGSMEWVTGPMQAWLLLDAADMLDENAKLREEFDKMDEWYSKELLAAIDENKKLRELVRDMWEGYNDPRCEECHLKDTPTCADCPICAREASVIDRMRELGVEV